MRIAIWAIGDFEEGHAANARIRALCEGWIASGHHLELLLLGPSVFNRTGINRRARGFWAGVPFRYFTGSAFYAHSFFLRGLLWIRSFWAVWFFLIRQGHQYDAFYLYAPNLLFFWPIYLVSKWKRIPIVAEITERTWTGPAPQAWHRRLLHGISRWEERWASFFWDHLLVISQRLYQSYQPYMPAHRMSILPIMVDLGRFSHLNGHVHRDHYIGYLGSFAQRDDIEGILKAFKTARQSNKQLKLRLMGFHPHPEQLEATLDQKGLRKHVEISGQLHFQDIPDLLYECDLLIVNRDDSPYAHYGFPTKLGEYLATGRPTVVTRVGDIPQYFEDGNQLRVINPGDPKALSEVMLERFEKDAAYEAMGQRGQIWVRDHFNHLKIAGIAERAIRLAVRSKRPGEEEGEYGTEKKGDRWVSNPRPPEPQSGALTN